MGLEKVYGAQTELERLIPRYCILADHSLGRLVREFDISGRSPGYHVVEWDALDNNGNQVSTGVYFIQFTSEASYQVKKIVFLK